MLNLALLTKFSMDSFVLGCQMSHVSTADILVILKKCFAIEFSSF